ncbi:MAG TPA: GFA family protein [Candidatus Binataceae bacterium]|nr:GFA family protein [Candidatus Binataceae bacterium]
MKIDGSCHCGKIAFEAEVDPNTAALCHCTDCQTMTGSAYRAVISASAASFTMLRGTPKIYIKTGESGRQRAQAFCADCGTPIYATSVTNPQVYSLRIGAIRQRAELPPRRQIWCRSALPWSSDLSGLEKTARQ